MSHKNDLVLIDKIKETVKQSNSVKKVFDEYQIDINEIDTIPICFADIDVSARTEKGIIYLNNSLKEDIKQIPHYLAHEITHYVQQTTGDGPTEGSTDDNYLENKFEQQGFRVQTEYLSETEGDAAAKDYINDVLDYHDVKNNKERKEKFKELLRLSD